MNNYWISIVLFDKYNIISIVVSDVSREELILALEDELWARNTCRK